MSEALNLADDQRPAQRRAALELLEFLERETPFPGAPRVGLTGAPGAGKSMLLDALVRTLRPRGETLAIVAVDPSSPLSGGALLGDRARMRSGATDEGVFLRSMAARDQLGGLAEATRAGVAILAAAFDRVFVETVGVGQSEVEVASLVDTLVYVASPGTGDLLQFMKAGVLEAPDVFAVNKADLGPSAERTAGELTGGLGLGECRDADWTPPVLLVSARDGVGIEALAEAIGAHFKHLSAGGRLGARRRLGVETWLLRALESRYGSYGIEQLGGKTAVRARLDAGGSAFAALARLAAEIEETLGKPR